MKHNYFKLVVIAGFTFFCFEAGFSQAAGKQVVIQPTKIPSVQKSQAPSQSEAQPVIPLPGEAVITKTPKEEVEGVTNFEPEGAKNHAATLPQSEPVKATVLRDKPYVIPYTEATKESWVAGHPEEHNAMNENPYLEIQYSDLVNLPIEKQEAIKANPHYHILNQPLQQSKRKISVK